MIDIEKERERTGYSEKSEQWQRGFDVAMNIAIKAESKTCKWRKNHCGDYDTSCGAYFGTHAWDFCQNCGRKIKEVGFEEIT